MRRKIFTALAAALIGGTVVAGMTLPAAADRGDARADQAAAERGWHRPAPTPTATPDETGCVRPEATRAPRNERSVRYNEWLGQTFTEVMFNTRDDARRQELLDRIVAEDYIQHNPLVPEGRAGLAAFIPVVYASIPDLCLTVRDVFATKDRVVARSTITGTVTGAPFLGVEARGQQLEFDLIDIWTVRDGQLYEHWDQIDWERVFVQLGVQGLPQPFIDVANQPYDR